MIVYYYPLLPFLVFVLPSHAQDLSAFDLIAHYTLQGTSQDATGNYDTIALINARYQGEEGVYCYGGYIFNGEDEDSSLVESPRIDVVNDTAFAVEVS